MTEFDLLLDNLSALTLSEKDHARHGRWEDVIRHEEAKSSLLLAITTHAAAASQGHKLIALFRQSMSDLAEIEEILETERHALHAAAPIGPRAAPYQMAFSA